MCRGMDNIVNQIKQDIFAVNGTAIDNFQLIREKWGVHVYNCMYEGSPAVVKYFGNESDKREITNYRVLNEYNIPTIKVFAYGKSSIVMEDIAVSADWRLGIEADLSDADIAECLADWYFNFHEKGLTIPDLNKLEGEFDKITEAALDTLCGEMPEAADTFKYILSRFDKLRKLIDTPTYTLTYNDFYWPNFIVRKDKREALMFDYNLLGRGYRYSDLRNVCWSLSNEAGTAFTDKYRQLYVDKYGEYRTYEEAMEKRIDDVMDELYGLIMAIERRKFSELAEFAEKESADRTLLEKVKILLE